MNHRQRASLIPKVDHSQKITNQLIRKILSHLSIFDICRSSRVCRRWREIVENDPKMFEYVNIEKIPQNVSLFSILKIFTRDKQILSLILPPQASQTDTSYLLGQLPPTIQQITFNNINMEFGKIFIRPMANVKKITFSNQTKRKKPFDEIEIKSLLMLSSTAQLNLFSIPFDDAIVNALKNFNNLLELTILDSPNLSNNTLQLLAKNCPGLLHLCLGGSEKLYNQLITKEGIQECKLESIELHYIARLGDDSIDIISKAMPNLKKFKIVRNNFERCAKISDASLKSLTRNNLTHLSIIYTRKLKKGMPQLSIIIQQSSLSLYEGLSTLVRFINTYYGMPFIIRGRLFRGFLGELAIN
ncbi:hypothetical protein pb186bvf_008929 [Paramecium bursaria]